MVISRRKEYLLDVGAGSCVIIQGRDGVFKWGEKRMRSKDGNGGQSL